jgi:hypothetical protein
MTMTQIKQVIRNATTVRVPGLGITAQVREIRTLLSGEPNAMIWGSDNHLYYVDFSELAA